MASREKLSAEFYAHGQGHLVEALDSLKNEEDRQILLEDLQNIDLRFDGFLADRTPQKPEIMYQSPHQNP